MERYTLISVKRLGPNGFTGTVVYVSTEANVLAMKNRSTPEPGETLRMVSLDRWQREGLYAVGY